jgi:hypothetical protein
MEYYPHQIREQRNPYLKEYQDRNNQIQKEELNQVLSQINDPITYIRIIKERDPEWRAWYNNLTPQEQQKTFQSISQILNMRINIESTQQWNDFFVTQLFWN